MRVISFAFCVLLISVPAFAENPTTVAFGCAPWDGRTLEINVGTTEVSYKVTIWGRGLDLIANGGKKLAIDNASGVSSAGYGRSETCSFGNHCKPKNVTIKFDKLDYREGGEIAGTIDKAIPFGGKIDAGPQFCG